MRSLAKDLGSTLVVGLMVLVFAAYATSGGILFLSGTRSVALSLVILGVVACSVGARVGPRVTLPMVAGMVLGSVALIMGIAAIVLAQPTLLFLYMALTVLLWLGASIVHVLIPERVAGAPPRWGTG